MLVEKGYRRDIQNGLSIGDTLSRIQEMFLTTNKTFYILAPIKNKGS